MGSLPEILFRRSVVTTSKTAIAKIQRLENKVWRYLLGIGGYSTVEALRGELGASMVKSRIMQTMLMYVADTLSGKFQNVKDMMIDTIEKETGKWYKAVNGYRNELGISWDDLQNLDKPSLKKLVKAYDTSEWEKGMAGKISLRFYIQEKSKIKYEH